MRKENRNWNGFLAAVAACVAGTASGQGATVTCESNEYKYAECRVSGGPVTMSRQLSTPPGDCVEGRTWGYDPGRGAVWVNNGCRAEFRVGGGGGGSEIAFYEFENFSGRSFRAMNSESNLNDSGFNDRASSVMVRGGRWQICEDAYFGGRCVTLGPGQYPSLASMELNNRVSSVRDLGWTPDGGGGWGGNRPPWGGGGNWGSESRAVLYAGYNLGGEAFVVNPRGVNDLQRIGFNDKARSLRVESGFWIFCSDANFEGNCHTYGPGDYPSLPSGQSHSISSGRRVSSNYPYRNNPTWSGN